MKRVPRGATMVEVLLGLLFVALVTLPFMKILVANVKAPSESWSQSRSMLLAQDLMDRIKDLRWDKLGLAGDVVTAQATLGQDSAARDDIDDWNGYVDEREGYERRVTVRFMAASFAGGVVTLTPSDEPTDTKQVEVRISGNREPDKFLYRLFTNAADTGQGS